MHDFGWGTFCADLCHSMSLSIRQLLQIQIYVTLLSLSPHLPTEGWGAQLLTVLQHPSSRYNPHAVTNCRGEEERNHFHIKPHLSPITFNVWVSWKWFIWLQPTSEKVKPEGKWKLLAPIFPSLAFGEPKSTLASINKMNNSAHRLITYSSQDNKSRVFSILVAISILLHHILPFSNQDASITDS